MASQTSTATSRRESLGDLLGGSPLYRSVSPNGTISLESEDGTRLFIVHAEYARAREAAHNADIGQQIHTNNEGASSLNNRNTTLPSAAFQRTIVNANKDSASIMQPTLANGVYEHTDKRGTGSDGAAVAGTTGWD